jgi:hypothetical protein
MTKELGTVTVDSGRLIVMDPCYQNHLSDDFVGKGKGNPLKETSHASVVPIQGFGGDGRFRVSGEFNERGFLESVTIHLQRDPLNQKV